MIKKLTITSFTVAMIFFPGITFAQNANTVVPNTMSTTGSQNKVPNTVKDAEIDARKNFKNQNIQSRNEFKAKISAIKDARKRAIVENIDTTIKSINEIRTQEMLNYLDKLTTILGKVSSKEAVLKSQGRDTTTLLNSIALATTAIESARTAVNSQTLKTYTATLTTDEFLRTTITTLLTQFKLDIKTTYGLVIAAQKAVLQSYRTAGLLTTTTLTPAVTAIPKP